MPEIAISHLRSLCESHGIKKQEDVVTAAVLASSLDPQNLNQEFQVEIEKVLSSRQEERDAIAAEKKRREDLVSALGDISTDDLAAVVKSREQ